MRPSVVLLLLVLAAGRLGAGIGPTTPEWRLSLVGAGEAAPAEVGFHQEADGVVVDGRIRFDPKARILHLQGQYRTRQVLDPRAALSYQVYAKSGKLLEPDGARFMWGAGVAGEQVADFDIEYAPAMQPWRSPGLRVQFNYVVEHEFWYRSRYPETVLPCLVIDLPPFPAHFVVRWSWVPPLLPAGTRCVLPVFLEAGYSGPPPPYQMAVDLLESPEGKRIESLRQALPQPQTDGWRGWVLCPVEIEHGGRMLARPGLVWDGVEWFDGFEKNPYRDVRVLGPLAYLLVLTVGGLAGMAGWALLARVRQRWWRWGGRLALALVGGLSLAGVAVSFYGLLLPGLLLIWWLQRRIVAPGPRTYWSVWLLVVMQELYWGHRFAVTDEFWSGTLISVGLAALVLVPLRWLKRPALAAGAGTAIGLTATLVAVALAVYYDFFHDYPGLRDLLYAGQVGETGDSVVELMGQRNLVPCWLWACATIGLWRR